MLCIAGTFAAFQAFMPMTGWICVHTIVEYFSAFEKFIPWIALILLAYIGGGMLLNGIRHKDKEEVSHTRLTAWALFIQGVATSIDALSVGFTIAEYDWLMALVCSLIIATVTLIICLSGLVIGKKFGTKLSNKADDARRHHPHRHRNRDLCQQRILKHFPNDLGGRLFPALASLQLLAITMV